MNLFFKKTLDPKKNIVPTRPSPRVPLAQPSHTPQPIYKQILCTGTGRYFIDTLQLGCEVACGAKPLRLVIDRRHSGSFSPSRVGNPQSSNSNCRNYTRRHDHRLSLLFLGRLCRQSLVRLFLGIRRSRRSPEVGDVQDFLRRHAFFLPPGHEQQYFAIRRRAEAFCQIFDIILVFSRFFYFTSQQSILNINLLTDSLRINLHNSNFIKILKQHLIT